MVLQIRFAKKFLTLQGSFTKKKTFTTLSLHKVFDELLALSKGKKKILFYFDIFIFILINSLIIVIVVIIIIILTITVIINNN